MQIYLTFFDLLETGEGGNDIKIETTDAPGDAIFTMLTIIYNLNNNNVDNNVDTNLDSNVDIAL